MLNQTTYNAFKGRSIDFTKEVKIYKNLHNGLWSIMQGGLVVAHVESFSMYGVSFKVSESGRQKVIRERKKYVHAFIVGRLLEVNCTDDDIITSNPHTRVRYNPYTLTSFVIGINDAPISSACRVYGCCKLGLVTV